MNRKNLLLNWYLTNWVTNDNLNVWFDAERLFGRDGVGIPIEAQGENEELKDFMKRFNEFKKYSREFSKKWSNYSIKERLKIIDYYKRFKGLGY